MAARRSIRLIEVRTLRAGVRGVLIAGGAIIPCVVGRSGCRAIKREGDGVTPIGRWPVRRAFYRPDRVRRPQTALPVQRIRQDDGWCDGAGDPSYNRHVRHPHRASAEELWREDELYDLLVVLGHNDIPRRRGGGSAIFIHVARPDWQPTAGCVAVRRAVLKRLVAQMGPKTLFAVNTDRRPKKKPSGRKAEG